MNEISTKELNTIKACRYCPMCRQSCPSEFINYKESDTPRGRAILLHNVYKGGKAFEASAIESIYNCFLCGACKSWCAGQELGGYDIPELIKFARKDIVDQGLAPLAIQQIRTALILNDNTSGLEKERAFTANITEKKAGLLFLLGADVNFFNPEIARVFMDILDKCEVDYSLLKGEPSSGKELDLLGYHEDAVQKARILHERITNIGSNLIVVADPLVYDALKNDYCRWSLPLESEVLHVSEYLALLIKEGKLSFRSVRSKVTLADSEILGRSNGLYEAPRDVIKAIAPENFVEMQWNRAYMQSVGEAAFTFDEKPFDRGKDLGRKLVEKAVAAQAEMIIVLSATAKRNISAATDLQVMDIAEFVASSLI